MYVQLFGGRLMKLSRLLILALFTLLSTGWLLADVVPPDPTHFIISLNNDGSDNASGVGGWGSNVTFNGTVNPEAPPGGYPTDSSETVSCSYNRHTHSVVCQVVQYEPCDIDPSAGTRLGGKSPDITDNFQITSNNTGGGSFHFEDNLGVPITSLELSATIAVTGTEVFTCNGGDAFSACGFIFSDPPGGTINVAVIFSQGHILPAPEPSTWILLGTAAMAVVGRRIRRRA